MRIRVTGLSLPWLGVQWERVPGDKEIAQELIIFLENRRLLFTNGTIGETERHCIESAIQIRSYMTTLISRARVGSDLENSLRAMRAACRRFVASIERNHQRPYYRKERKALLGLALGDLRTLMGIQIAQIARQYDLALEPELARIVPPEDDELAWLPGFDVPDP